jgi:META domain
MTMVCLRWRAACWLVWVMFSSSILPVAASESAFPFDRELMLDVAPMRGSKRVPILEIAENGAATIDLWCTSVRAAANVGDDSITIVPDTPQPAQCTPERQSSDDSLLAALAQVTNWRRNGEVVEFIGATTLRFRLMTN